MYSQQLLLDSFLVLGRGLGGSAALLLEAVEGVQEVVLHEILVQDADQPLLLERDRVQGKILRKRVLRVHGGQLVGRPCLGRSSTLVLLLFGLLHATIMLRRKLVVIRGPLIEPLSLWL
jgi:hypothetical protein